MTHSQIVDLILAARLSLRRLNDITAAMNAIFRIAFYTVKDTSGVEEQRPCLKDAKQNEYALSINQLAALRLRIGSGISSAIWADEFRSNTDGAILQEYLRMPDAIPQGKTIEDMRFKVVHELKVKNHLITSSVPVPVYKDFCYEGSLEYTRGIRTLMTGKTREFYKTPEYNRGMAELREALHLSKVKPGQDKEENVVKLPVFEITWA